MPSVDQTALATLSAKSLGWDYRGTLFEFSLIDTIAPYIDLHGDAFRSVEHSILSSVLSVEPTETVTACRGCTTELSENGEMLKSLGGVVVGVMREVECVFKCLCTASQIPSYIRETAEVAWEKKKAYFSTPCSSSISHPPPFVRSGIQTGASSSNTSKKTISRLSRFTHGLCANNAPLSNSPSSSSANSTNTYPLQTCSASPTSMSPKCSP